MGVRNSDCCLRLPSCPITMENTTTLSQENGRTRQPRHINAGKEVTSGIFETAAFANLKRVSALSLLSFQGQRELIPIASVGSTEGVILSLLQQSSPQTWSSTFQGSKAISSTWAMSPGCIYLYCTPPLGKTLTPASQKNRS